MPGTRARGGGRRRTTVVEAGDTLAVLEAMKMELALKAPFDGIVTSVAVTVGAQVELGAELFVVERAGGRRSDA